MYQAIIFDLGGVIEKINPEAVIKQFTALGMKNADSFFSLFKQSDICTAFELGKISENEFIYHLAQLCNPNTPIELIKSVWCANQLGVSKETVSTLNRIKQLGLKLYILSNTNEIHAEAIENAFLKAHSFDLKSLFTGIYYSFKTHLRKPYRSAYQYLLDDVHLSPEKCIYVDDLESNLIEPKNMGMNCIFSKTNKELKDIDFILRLTNTC